MSQPVLPQLARRARWILVLLLAGLLGITGCGKPERPTMELYLAVHRGDLNQIERHIQWGSDINAIDADGRTPLHVAARKGQTAVVNLLLKHGARVNVPDQRGNSALHDALLAGRTQIADLLIRNGAEVDLQRLLWAVVDTGLADRDVIEWLARRGADLNQQREQGDTPLTRAVRDDQRVLAKLLVEQGADVNQPDGQGELPLELAASLQDQSIHRLLQSRGARAARAE